MRVTNDLRFVQFGRGGTKAMVQRNQTVLTREKSGKSNGKITGQREMISPTAWGWTALTERQPR
jgi:hypothetical protein